MEQSTTGMYGSQDRPIQKERDIYKRIKLLGRGSYGRAYLVKDVQTEQNWVVKQINMVDLTGQQQQAAVREAKILQLLNNNNIVRFREVYRTVKQKLNIVMQYASSGDLGQLIKKAKENTQYFSQNQIMAWFVQICLGLKHIHENKIIHRDLKPQNIFLTQDGIVKIGDFGVSRLMDNTLAKAKTVVGSPYYLSPQVIEGRHYSSKTDMWSLGAILYELCALTPPFSGNNLQFLALKIVQGVYPDIPKQYSPALRFLIKSLLQTKDSNRPDIRQIFSSSIVTNNIGMFLKDLPSNPRTTPQFGKLQAPPDLLILQNKSEILTNKVEPQMQSPVKPKTKTPQIAQKKGPNNFFNRPVTGKRKVSISNDLADLIQIKPSQLQIHQKIQRPIVEKPLLPKVPKSSQKALASAVNVKIVANNLKLQNHDKIEVAAIKQKLNSLPATAFSKKRPSVVAEPIPSKVSIQLKPVVKTDQQKAPNTVKIRRKAPVKTVKPPQDTNLQLCSQQAKKKIARQKKTIVQKKKLGQKRKKRPISQQIDTQRQQQMHVQQEERDQQLMQQQKCSDIDFYASEKMFKSYDYEQDDFDSYSSDQEQVDLEFSETLIANNKNQSKIHIGNKELADIKQLVNQAWGKAADLASLAQSIPQLIHLSADLRQDDDEQPQQLKETVENPSSSNATSYTGDLALTCMQQLQSLRMHLEQIFGVQSLVYAYHQLEKRIEMQGLNFQQQKAIKDILKGRPQIDEETLRNYFGLIVTMISREKCLV